MSSAPRRSSLTVGLFLLILLGAAVAVPAVASLHSSAPQGSASRPTAFLDPSLGGGDAVAALNAVYNSRADLQAAYPDAMTDVTGYSELVTWAAGVVTGQWSDPAYATLAPYGYWYVLMSTYNDRTDLQSAFPDAYTNFTTFTELVGWAASVVEGAFSDGAYLSLASYGYWYVLMATYSERADLQTAFPGAYTDSADFVELVDWADGVVTGAFSDGAYSVLAPYGYWYALMGTYNGRADLQSAFPDAASNFTEFTDLVDWASAVSAQQWTDSAYATLVPFGYWYALMATYNERPDLQATFPAAYANFGSYTELVQWAGQVVTGAFADGANSTLSPFGFYYVLLNVYDGRADLLAAFPDAFTNWSSQQALTSWAGGVESGAFTDSAQGALGSFGYWYVLYGWVYGQRSDLQAAFPLAGTNQPSSQGLFNWADEVVNGDFSDPAESTLAPFAADY